MSNIGGLSPQSVKSLYPLALAEGEGIGTAYEYLVKRRVLSSWIKGRVPKGPLLIAGLPEKYGSSLDFHLLADELGVEVIVADDRPEALAKAQDALAAAQQQGLLGGLKVDYLQVTDLVRLNELSTGIGICMSCEVCQRLTRDRRNGYWFRMNQLAPIVAVFAPNADNPAHTNISGLTGLSLSEMNDFNLWNEGAERSSKTGNSVASKSHDHRYFSCDYVDLPPFPPGMERSKEQRKKAATGRFEATAMWGLDQFAWFERLLPVWWRRSRAHIVFALSRII